MPLTLSTDHIFSRLQEDGFVVLSNYFDCNDVDNLQALHISEQSIASDDSYLNGRIYRSFISLTPRQRSISQTIKSILPGKKNCAIIINQEHVYFSIANLLCSLSTMITFKPPKELQVFHTSDNVNTIHSAQKPHFDYRPCLKAMIYLDDCRHIDSGGLYLIPGSHDWTRRSTAYKRVLNESPGRTDPHIYFEKSPFTLQNFVYMGANAGDILLFLTDNFHFQGINKKTKFNRISRIHAYLD